ncbi:MAG: FAD-dependent oxidoreductase [Acidobacteria bacterium]|nr:FAD-dependent oxidoreductase [Acidobacteriota bacterium]
MTNRYAVIGGVAAGMSAASRIRKVDPESEIVVFEKGEYISYSACSMPYYISNPKTTLGDLIVLSVDDARNKRRIDVRTGHMVTQILPAQRRIKYAKLPSGLEGSYDYDRLVIATGATPYVPPIPGSDRDNVFVLRTLEDGQRIKQMLESGGIKKAAILGAGYVGLEMCESLRKCGVEVTLISARAMPMFGWNEKIVATVIETLNKNGVNLTVNGKVERITDSGVRLNDRLVEADLVLVAKGIRPNGRLAEEAGIHLGVAGAIAVDQRMETSVAGIFAAGDCAESFHRINNKKIYVPLGTVANKHGRVAGLNCARQSARFPGVISSAEFKLFEMEVASTGMTRQVAVENGFDAEEIVITASSAAHGYPESYPIQVAMVGDKSSGRLLGAQMIGQDGVAERINIVAVAIFNGNTVDEFSMFDLAYAPPFAPVWDPVLVAANVLKGKLGKF